MMIHLYLDQKVPPPPPPPPTSGVALDLATAVDNGCIRDRFDPLEPASSSSWEGPRRGGEGANVRLDGGQGNGEAYAAGGGGDAMGTGTGTGAPVAVPPPPYTRCCICASVSLRSAEVRGAGVVCINLMKKHPFFFSQPLLFFRAADLR